MGVLGLQVSWVVSEAESLVCVQPGKGQGKRLKPASGCLSLSRESRL